VLWRLVGWLFFTLAQRGVALAGDADRERATARLREGYAGGQLTLDEFSRRAGRVLSARSHWQLRRSVFDLPRQPLFAPVHALVRAVVTGAYLVFTLALGLMLAVALLLGASMSTVVLFALVWLIPTYLFARFRRGH
jgi:uncharacterized protein DUF1707